MRLIEHDTAGDRSEHAGEHDTHTNAARIHLMAGIVRQDDLLRHKKERKRGLNNGHGTSALRGYMMKRTSGS